MITPVNYSEHDLPRTNSILIPIRLKMVNTFLPYADFRRSVATLDDARCGKQRVEAYQLIKALEEGTRWQKHPACIMWRGYENALKSYYNICIDEWVSRGKNNTMKKIKHGEVVMPWWMGWEHFHYSHRASLLRKFPDHYEKHFSVDKYYMKRGYIWPSKHKSKVLKITDRDALNELFEPIQLTGIRPREETRKNLYRVAELREMAKARGLTGYSGLNKDALIDLLELFPKLTQITLEIDNTKHKYYLSDDKKHFCTEGKQLSIKKLTDREIFYQELSALHPKIIKKLDNPNSLLLTLSLIYICLRKSITINTITLRRNKLRVNKSCFNLKDLELEDIDSQLENILAHLI